MFSKPCWCTQPSLFAESHNIKVWQLRCMGVMNRAYSVTRQLGAANAQNLCHVLQHFATTAFARRSTPLSKMFQLSTDRVHKAAQSRTDIIRQVTSWQMSGYSRRLDRLAIDMRFIHAFSFFCIWWPQMLRRSLGGICGPVACIHSVLTVIIIYRL